jgi:hypothetical protein
MSKAGNMIIFYTFYIQLLFMWNGMKGSNLLNGWEKEREIKMLNCRWKWKSCYIDILIDKSKFLLMKKYSEMNWNVENFMYFWVALKSYRLLLDALNCT